MSFLKKRSPDRSPGSIFIFILSYSAQDRACYQRYERQRAVHIFAKRIKSLAEGLFYALADRLNGGLFFQHPEEHHRLYITTFSAKFPVLKLTDFYSNKNTVGGRRGAGFRPGDKSFGSLLGLSCYLDRDSFRGLLRSISDLWSDGSAICFDYQTPDGSGETRRNEQLAGAAGESMKAKYTAAETEKMLADCGFLIYEQLDDEEMTKRYFAPCRDDMRAPKGVNYILAVKKR